jgi:hypothetical protein
MVWLHKTTSVVFTMPIDVVSIEVLLIEEYNNFIIGFAYYCTSKTKGSVFTLH